MFVFRGVGCIFFEMGSGRPLFPGATVDEELELIVRSLGPPPPEATPPALHAFLANRKNEPPRPLLAPRLDPAALDLLPKFLSVSTKHKIISKLLGLTISPDASYLD